MLSLIIPTYNAASLLPRLFLSLDSAPDWEVIIVDDGSSDGTVEVAKRWIARRTHGFVLCLDHGGPGRARAAGLERASGVFVAFADADDEVITSVHNQGARALVRLGADVCIAQYARVPAPTPTPRRDQRTQFKQVGPGRVLRCRAAIWGKVYRRQFLEDNGLGFPPLRSADDVIFTWRVAAARPKTIETSAVSYLYHVDPHGQLTREARYFWEGVDSLESLLHESRGRPTQAKVLALYAYATGALHIVRKLPLSMRTSSSWRLARGAFGSLAMSRRPAPECSRGRGR